MIDPKDIPCFTGMGVNENNGRYTEFKFRVISLIDQTEIFTFQARTPTRTVPGATIHRPAELADR